MLWHLKGLQQPLLWAPHCFHGASVPVIEWLAPKPQDLHIEPCWPFETLKSKFQPPIAITKLIEGCGGIIISIRDAQNSANWSSQTWFQLNHRPLLTGDIFRFQDGRSATLWNNSWRSCSVSVGWLKSSPISSANCRKTGESWIGLLLGGEFWKHHQGKTYEWTV